MSIHLPPPELISISETEFTKRRNTLAARIAGSIALITNSSEKRASRDQHFPFLPDSDFFYLTGISDSHGALLIDARLNIGGSRKTSEQPKFYLFLKDSSAKEAIWNGQRLSIKQATKMIAVDKVFPIAELDEAIATSLTHAEYLYYNPGADEEIDETVFKLFVNPLSPSLLTPLGILDVRTILAEMRALKSVSEIAVIRQCIEETINSFNRLLSEHELAGKTESTVARILETYFAEQGADRTAFPTIIASGKNATCLHHTPQGKLLKKGELLLIDAGLRRAGYNSDLTRTIPIGKGFSPEQSAIYDIVQQANAKAIQRVAAGRTMKDVHLAAVKVIDQGLRDLKIIKKAAKPDSYQQYYMHSTSHFLGIDVHDIAPRPTLSRPTTSRPTTLRPGANKQSKQTTAPCYTHVLKRGHVITIEPGIYISHNDTSVAPHWRGIGIRLEDDVLVTDRGSEVLSKPLPTKRLEIEALVTK